MALPSTIHLGLPPPGCLHRLALVAGPYRYYHYGCDGVDDRGWGCGYRTLQTMCSWLAAAGGEEASLCRPVPSLKEIQDSLVEMGDKPASFAGSRDWIGTVEAALCMDHFYGVPGKLLHVRIGQDLGGELETLYAHFQGGDDDLFVNPKALTDYLHQTPNASRFIHGNIQHHSKVMWSGKYAVSWELYTLEHYPNFASGGGFIMAQQGLPALY
ncbi:hypothetical protein E2320_022366 [Naja naja]|nr:hypothetical protein E2320_022366 [Naja naja]